MSDTTATAGAGPGPAADSVPLRFRGQYVRDFSFEVPHAPEIFTELRQKAPDIPITVEPAVRHLNGSLFEVTLTANVEAKAADRIAFILEVVYAGVVELDERVIPQEHVHPILMIEVPRFLFPFVRQMVSDTTVGGGFPPLMLQMIDFAELYRRRFGDTPQTVARNPAAATTKH
ncbi:MAG: protein-export chaperone SecB [Rhodospirillaceae bacterium]|nr:protein-export chaperone SecB [Rhodospirillaceae bacterium]